MPVLVVCPNEACGASLSMSPELIGRRVRCKKCGTKFEAVGETSDGQVIEPSDPGSDHARSASASDLPSAIGRYKILKKLGQGGMGTVYLARDTELDRLVAVKVPHIDADSSPDVYERFRREARAAAGFHHPNFCTIHDVGQVGHTLYLAMAYIKGATLESRVSRDNPMPPREAAAIVRQLAIALAEAHRRGIIHRDLKPANVMVDVLGNLILMDFGLARRIEADEPRLTQTGVPMGTPSYMSPEQVKGTKHDLGPTTDVYSLGVILYELSTGRRPFEGNVGAVIGQVLHVEPRSPSSLRPEIDAELEAITLKAMAKKIEARYPAMEALAEALGGYLAPRPVAPPPKRRRPLLAAGALLLALLGVIVYVATDKGTLQVEGFVPEMEIRVDGQEVRIEKVGEPIVVSTGKHGLLITRGDVVIEAPKSFEVRRGQQLVITLKLVPPPVVETSRSPETLPPPPPSPVITTRLTDQEAAIASLIRGNGWYRQAEFNKALADYEQAIKLDPKSAAAFVGRGNCWRDKRDYDQGLADYEEAIKLDPNYAPAYTGRGACSAHKKDYEKALADYEQAITLDPNDAPAYYHRGNYWREKNEYEKALTDYERAIKLDPKYARAYLGRGSYWRHKTEFDKALADFDLAIRLNPNYATAYNTRGACWKVQGNIDKAMADYQDAIRIDPKYALAYTNRGLCWQAKGDNDKALADYNQAIKIDPKYALAYINRGNWWREKNEHDTALADFNLAIEVDPKYAIAYFNRANCWHEQKELEKATADYDEAIRLDPNYASAYFNRGNCWREKKEVEKALDDYDEAIRIDPKYASAYTNRGLCWQAKGDVEKALADYNQAIKIDPRHEKAFSNRGVYWREKKEFAKALADFDEAIKIAPNDAFAYTKMAWILATCSDARYRDGKRAVQLALKACELRSFKDEDDLNTLAAAHAEAGEFEQAVRREQDAIGLAKGRRLEIDRTRLKLYEAKQPYRHEPPKPPDSAKPLAKKKASV